MGRVLAAIAALLLTSGVAQAADPISYGTSTQAVVPLHDQATMDWTGFYAGVLGTAGPDAFGAGIALGYNVALGFGLVGAEVAALGTQSDDVLVGSTQVLARGGVLVTDQLLAYGALGYSAEFGDDGADAVLVGGGIEYALNPDVSMRGQYLYGDPIGEGDAIHQVSFGANFHF